MVTFASLPVPAARREVVELKPGRGSFGDLGRVPVEQRLAPPFSRSVEAELAPLVPAAPDGSDAGDQGDVTEA